MKIVINNSVTKEIQPLVTQTQTRSLDGGITESDVHNIVNITFTFIEAVKIVFSIVRGWF